jgi:hypothetical protein
VRRARLAPEMISTPGQGVLRRRQRRALPAWLHVGEPSRFSRQSRSTLSGTAKPVARARWRRCFPFSLAFRLSARFVLLDLAVFITQGSDLDEIGHSWRVSFAEGRRVGLGVAQSRIPAIPKLTDPASLREGAPQRPFATPDGETWKDTIRSMPRVRPSAGPRKSVRKPHKSHSRDMEPANSRESRRTVRG